MCQLLKLHAMVVCDVLIKCQPGKQADRQLLALIDASAGPNSTNLQCCCCCCVDALSGHPQAHGCKWTSKALERCRHNRANKVEAAADAFAAQVLHESMLADLLMPTTSSATSRVSALHVLPWSMAALLDTMF